MVFCVILGIIPIPKSLDVMANAASQNLKQNHFCRYFIFQFSQIALKGGLS